MSLHGKLAILSLMMGGIFMDGMGSSGPIRHEELSEEDKALLKAKAEQRRRELMRKQGMKEFHYADGITIIALNEKNADRKYNNLMRELKERN